MAGPYHDKAARKAYLIAWRLTNRKRLKAQSKAYAKSLWARCKDRRSKENLAWRKAHPELVRHYHSKNKAKRRGAAGTHTLSQWMARVEYFGWRCFYCRVVLTVKTLTKDHTIPLSKDGTDWASNLRPACKHCNCSKGDKLP